MYVRDKNVGIFSSKSTEDSLEPYVLGEETQADEEILSNNIHTCQVPLTDRIQAFRQSSL